MSIWDHTMYQIRVKFSMCASTHAYGSVHQTAAPPTYVGMVTSQGKKKISREMSFESLGTR